MEIVLGIDIGGTSTKLGLVREDGRLLEKRTVHTGACHNEFSFFSLLFEEIDAFLDPYTSIYQWEGIGIGAPSCNEKAGTLEKAANFPFSDTVPILKLFKERFGLPVYLIKDGNAATVGEGIYGAARNMESFILVTLGTGIGGGIMVNRQLIKGANGWAGEFGHLKVEDKGRKCGCGRFGCLETYASATGLRETTLRKLQEGNVPKSLLQSLKKEDLQAIDVYTAAQKGDPLALQVFEEVARYLGVALANMAAIFDPEAIILTGGLSAAGTVLFKPLKTHFNATIISQLSGKIPLLPSALQINEAAILGAASLVWKNKNLITT